MKKLSDLAFAIAVFGILPAAPAYAYLDGATVSMVLQAVTGAIAGILLFGKLYWAKFKGLFRRSDGGLGD